MSKSIEEIDIKLPMLKKLYIETTNIENSDDPKIYEITSIIRDLIEVLDDRINNNPKTK